MRFLGVQDGRLRMALALGLGGTAALVGCQPPTQITLSLRTDVEHVRGRSIAIRVVPLPSVDAATKVTEWQTDVLIGTLVLVPKAAKDGLADLRIVMGVARDASECTTEKADGCIIARRRISFVENVALKLPVALHARCIGVPCDEDTTCNALGKCVSSHIDSVACENTDCNVPDDVFGSGGPGGAGGTGSLPELAVVAGGDHVATTEI